MAERENEGTPRNVEEPRNSDTGQRNLQNPDADLRDSSTDLQDADLRDSDAGLQDSDAQNSQNPQTPQDQSEHHSHRVRRRMSAEHIRRIKRKRRSRRILIAVVVVLLALASFAVAFVWSVMSARSELQQAVASAKGLQDTITQTDGRQLDTKVNEFSGHVDKAYRQTSSFLWTVASHVPYVGDDVSAVRTTVASLEDISSPRTLI